MNHIINIISKILFLEKEPQKIGLCQLKNTENNNTKPSPSLNTKNVKLSDLMRRVG